MTDEATNAAAEDPETRAASPDADADAREAHAHAPLRLHGELEPRADGRYRVEELFALHDRAFVENVFRAALGRAPDAAEAEATLSDLRSSRRGKREIVEDLVFSEEGRRGGASERVGGVGDPRLRRRVRSLPVVGYLWQLLAGLARLPRLMRHQREFEAYALAQQQLIADRLNEQERRVQASLTEQVRAGLGRFDADLVASVEDAREAVFILSDALASLSARHAEEAGRREQSEAHNAARFDTQQQGIVELQHALEAARRGMEEQRHGIEEQQRRLEAQEEFLIEEQRAIVEAQKAALAGLEERLREAESSARRASEALARQAGARATLPPAVGDA